MSTAEQGKFCNHCNKTVFDFTTATDAEIVKHIKAMKGEMFCGRFEENQLDKWIERSDIKTSNPRLYKFLLSIILLGAVQGSHAQNKSPQENVEAKKKLDSLLNVQIAYSEIGINPCDTTIKPVVRVVRDSKIIIGRAQANFFYKADPLIIVDGVRFKKDSFNNLNTNKINMLARYSAQVLEHSCLNDQAPAPYLMSYKRIRFPFCNAQFNNYITSKHNNLQYK